MHVVPVFRYSKAQTRLGLHFVPPPAEQLMQPGALSQGAVHLIPSMVPALVSPHASRVCLVSVLGSWSLAAALLADVNHSESQKVFG